MKDAHAYCKYKCSHCRNEVILYCTRGIEDGPNSKPAPSPIACRCGGLLFRSSKINRLLVLRRLSNENYLIAYKGIKHGVPVFAKESNGRNNEPIH